MTDRQGGAGALIAGSIMTVMVFLFHPTRVVETPVIGPFTMSQLVHSTAILAAPLLLYGMWGMGAWMGLGRMTVRSGLVFAAFAMILSANAAVVSSFVTPAAARASMPAHGLAAVHAAPPAGHGHATPMRVMPPLVQLSVSLNRGLAQAHVALLSIALALFGAAFWSERRGLAVSGLIVGVPPLVWQASGRFSPETYTMPLVVFPQCFWLIAAAVVMLRATRAERA